MVYESKQEVITIVYRISSIIRQRFYSSKTIGSRSLGLLRKGKTHIKAKFHRNDLVIYSHSREGKPHLIAE